MNKFIAALLPLFALSACEDMPTHTSSDQLQNQKQEELTKRSVQSVGLPAIVNNQEKRVYKDIYELRDRPNLVTYTYITDMNGGLHKVCDSIGFGISESTQYTSPEKLVRTDLGEWEGESAMPQADPNGLFSSPSSNGTWVMCKVPGKDEVQPIRAEPNLITSPFPLK
jgi:hypothetical protein